VRSAGRDQLPPPRVVGVALQAAFDLTVA
jgi:hypothetical protein